MNYRNTCSVLKEGVFWMGCRINLFFFVEIFLQPADKCGILDSAYFVGMNVTKYVLFEGVHLVGRRSEWGGVDAKRANLPLPPILID